MEQRGLLQNAQHAYRRNRSTVTAITEVLEYIPDAFDAGGEVMLGSCDLSKAFDSMDHSIMIKKTGDIWCPWFGKGANNEESIETALLEAGEWFGGNRLKLNDLKTKKLRISTTITKNEEQEVKFLGLVLTSSLNWRRHVDNLRGILASAIFSIRRLQQTPYEASRSAYFAMFESRATYGILLWGASSAMETIFRLQKEAVRALAGVPKRTTCRNLQKEAVRALAGVPKRTTCRNLYPEHQILTLPSLFVLACLKYVQIPKLIHDSVSPNKQESAHYKPPCNKTLQSTSRRDEGHVQTKLPPSGQGIFDAANVL
ncbi:hypothetical protein QE152_g13218 [Popillia japonica]|uniref:Reverse transcriptase domain-containing protein n=1 Tax=Popillia japonica TaxID=7064 RepID=A0AAW1LET7_POPJA